METSEYRKARGILNAIPPELKKKIYAVGKSEHIEKGRIVFREGSIENDLVFVISGHIALCKAAHKGNRKTFFICSDNELLNETVLQSGRSSVSAIALSDAEILRCPLDSVEELIQTEPVLMQAVFNSLSDKTRRLYHQAEKATGGYGLEGRLALRIRKLARDYGVDEPEGRRIDMVLSVTMLASILGVSREAVSRLVSKMRKKGILSYENGVLIVTDMERLQSFISIGEDSHL